MITSDTGPQIIIDSKVQYAVQNLLTEITVGTSVVEPEPPGQQNESFEVNDYRHFEVKVGAAEISNAGADQKRDRLCNTGCHLLYGRAPYSP